LDLGYTQSLRRQFLAENQVDPVDIVNCQLFANEKLDLSLPFFGDPAQASVDQPSGTLAKWMKLRAEANHRLVQELVSQFSCPILFQLRHNIQETITLSGYQVVPWKVSPNLPASSYPSFEEEGDRVPADGYCFFPFGHPVDPPVTSRLYDNLLRRIKKSKGKLAIDMSSMPIEDLPKTLDRWFAKG